MLPLLQYTGGKRREIKHIKKYIPNDINTYIEPFFGGGALYFHLEPKKAIIADNNEPLRLFYEEYREKPAEIAAQFNELHNQLLSLPKEEQKAWYFKIRDEYFENREKEPHNLAAVYFFVGKHSFSHSSFSASYKKNGFYHGCYTCKVEQEQAQLLANATILDDYKKALECAKKNDFVFLDPPYLNCDVGYGTKRSKKYLIAADDIINNIAKEIEKQKTRILLIINKTPQTESLFKDYICEEYNVVYARTIRYADSDQTQHRNVHIVIKNY